MIFYVDFVGHVNYLLNQAATISGEIGKASWIFRTLAQGAIRMKTRLMDEDSDVFEFVREFRESIARLRKDAGGWIIRSDASRRFLCPVRKEQSD